MQTRTSVSPFGSSATVTVVDSGSIMKAEDGSGACFFRSPVWWIAARLRGLSVPIRGLARLTFSAPRSDEAGMRQLSSRLGWFSIVALTVLVASACSASGRTAGGGGRLVRVSERDFHITVAPNHVPAGDVLLVVRNQGPDTHELIIVRSRARLPLRRDGLTVDERALDPVTVASLDGAGPGAVRREQLHLAPGRYELFCNMAGHFMAGMRGELVVD
jgi:uncharacterized cupredoxin-like copper-binding protein